MVRHFTGEPVAPEVIARMLELARHAPSAGFTQGQAFVVVLLLAAVNEGLAAGFAGVTSLENLQALRELLGLPEEVTPVGVIPIGHRAADKASPSLKRGRKAQAEYVHYERW